MQHKHSFKKFFIPSILFLTGLLLGFYFLFFINTTFMVKQVEIFGVDKEDHEVISLLLKGLSTLTIQSSEIERVIHMRFPTMDIKESRIQFPDTLILYINKEKPIAFLRTDYGYLALSKNGTIIKKERTSTIPHPSITFYQTIHHSGYQMGQRIGFTAVERALTFIALLRDEGYEAETVAIDSVDMIACKTKGFEVVFSQSRAIEMQSHEVRQIIRQLKAGALRIGRLDLRFDKPVVQLPQK